MRGASQFYYLEISIHLEGHILLLLTRCCLGIRAHTLLKEVVLILEGNALHESERVRRAPDLRVAQHEAEAIGHELNILRHKFCIHTDQLTRQGLRDELLFYFYSLTDQRVNLLLR